VINAFTEFPDFDKDKVDRQMMISSSSGGLHSSTVASHSVGIGVVAKDDLRSESSSVSHASSKRDKARSRSRRFQPRGVTFVRQLSTSTSAFRRPRTIVASHRKCHKAVLRARTKVIRQCPGSLSCFFALLMRDNSEVPFRSNRLFLDGRFTQHSERSRRESPPQLRRHYFPS